MTFYAHSKKNAPPEQWQPLDAHLKNVAEKAAKFAKPFGGEEWAYIAGLWHKQLIENTEQHYKLG